MDVSNDSFISITIVSNNTRRSTDFTNIGGVKVISSRTAVVSVDRCQTRTSSRIKITLDTFEGISYTMSSTDFSGTGSIKVISHTTMPIAINSVKARAWGRGDITQDTFALVSMISYRTRGGGTDFSGRSSVKVVGH